MNKKLYAIALVAAGLIQVGCSSESEDANNGIAPDMSGDVIGLDLSSASIDPGIPTDQSSAVNPGSSAAFVPTSGETLTPVTSSFSTTYPPENPKQNKSSSSQDITPALSSIADPNPVSSSSTAKSSSSKKASTNDDSLLPPAGFYTSLTVNPPTATMGGQVRCSFDGSVPTQNSEQFTAAKQITQNSVVRCAEFVNGQAVRTSTQTYFINENVQMPVVALTVNHYDMFDSTNGLYATGEVNSNPGGMNNPGGPWGGGMGGGMGGGFDFGGFGNVNDDNNPKCTEPCEQANFWRDTELPVHVEYFENGSSTKTKTWEIDAGISIIGNWSRYKPKKSVAIKMNSQYQDGRLKYQLFDTRPDAKKFKSFNLRNNGNRFWTDYVGDAMMTSLMEGTSVDYQRSRQVVVFYNGEYFGIHDMRERLNRHFVETNYGIESSEINMVKIKGSSLEASGEDGRTDEYQQVLNLFQSNNFAGANNQQYEQLKTKFDVGSFAEYILAEIYMHNGDWPNNNVRAWGGNGHPFKFVIFDVDHGFGFTPGISGFDPQSTNMFQWMNNNAMDARSPAGMFKKLCENEDFKRLFLNRAAVLLTSYLTYEKVQATVKAMMATIPQAEQQRDQQRFPRNQSRFTWDPTGNTLVQYAANRTQTVRQEVEQQFGVSGEVQVTIAASGNGEVLLEDLRLPSKNYSAKFFNGVQMKLTAVATNGSVFAGWDDGSTENPRIVSPTNGVTYTANFK